MKNICFGKEIGLVACGKRRGAEDRGGGQGNTSQRNKLSKPIIKHELELTV